jgi:hypothetical protein
MSGYFRLEPLGTQKRGEQIDEEENGDQGAQNNHGSSFQTRSHATTKANMRPSVASPKKNMAGSQTVKSIEDPFLSQEILAEGDILPQKASHSVVCCRTTTALQTSANQDSSVLPPMHAICIAGIANCTMTRDQCFYCDSAGLTARI